jgi:hypothetical protein
MSLVKRHYLPVIAISGSLGALVAVIVGDPVAGIVAAAVILAGLLLAFWELAPFVDREGNENK